MKAEIQSKLRALSAAIAATPPGEPMAPELMAQANGVANVLIVALLEGVPLWHPPVGLLSAGRCAEARRAVGPAVVAQLRGAIKTEAEMRQVAAIALPLLSALDVVSADPGRALDSRVAQRFASTDN